MQHKCAHMARKKKTKMFDQPHWSHMTFMGKNRRKISKALNSRSEVVHKLNGRQTIEICLHWICPREDRERDKGNEQS